jgi:hypothetical protein
MDAMSLTSHLRVRDDPVRAYIEGVAPEVARIAHRSEESARFRVADLPELVVPPLAKGRALAAAAGIAFDYRLRYSLGPQEREGLVAWGGAQELIGFGYVGVLTPGSSDGELIEAAILSFFDGLDQLLARLEPTGRQLPDDSERLLCRNCVALAYLDSIFRSGLAGYTPPFVIELVEQLRGCRDSLPPDVFLRLASEDAVNEVVQLSRSAESAFAAQIAAVTSGELPYVLNPTFDGSLNVGGADADFVIGDTLFELKTTARLNASTVREAMLQLIGYSLLDFSDRYGIRNVGAYFTRHGWVATWPLNDLISGEGDVVERLAEARKGLKRRFKAPRC